MHWYYVRNGAQAGPVAEEQLLELVRAGVVQAETLVWQAGMAEWMPYRLARTGVPAGPSADVPETGAVKRTCAQCGLTYPESEVVPLGGAYTCVACKPIALERFGQGTWNAVGSRRFAGFWIRLAAYLVDLMLVGILFTFLTLLLGLGAMTGEPVVVASSAIIYLALAGTAQLVYQLFFLTKYGATPGKMVLGLKVVRGDGTPLSSGRALMRTCARGISGLVLYLGYVMIALDAEKRGLHDHVADTRVVYEA